MEAINELIEIVTAMKHNGDIMKDMYNDALVVMSRLLDIIETGRTDIATAVAVKQARDIISKG